MHALVRTVFTRLHQLDSAVEEQKLKEATDEAQENDVKMNVQTDGESSTTDATITAPADGSEIQQDEPQELPADEPISEAVPPPVSPGRLPKVQCMLLNTRGITPILTIL